MPDDTLPYARAKLLSDISGRLTSGESVYGLAPFFHRDAGTGDVEVYLPATAGASFALLASGGADELETASRALAAAARWARGQDDDPAPLAAVVHLPGV